jgi:Allene oxide cyclase barrel like domain
MRTKLWTLVLAVAILGFVMGGVAVSLRPTATSAVATSVGTTHLKFLVKFIGQDTFLDLGAPGPSQGDEFILHDLVFTPDGRTQVGHDGGMCVIFDVAIPEENCTVTYSLPGGDITTQFLNSPPPAKTFAITGGTGSYRNVRGQGELVELGNETATLSFDLIG